MSLERERSSITFDHGYQDGFEGRQYSPPEDFGLEEAYYSGYMNGHLDNKLSVPEVGG